MSLSNKVAVVTGGSSGIGACKEGAKVVIVGRNENKLANVEKEVAQRGSRPLVIAADVTRDVDAKRIVEDTLKHFGMIDILINNAGIARASTILDPECIQKFDEVFNTNHSILDADCMKGFDEVLNINLRAAVYLTHLAAPHLVETKGKIINISSMAAYCVMSLNAFIYSTAKAGLDYFTRCIALEFARKGVRANCINPGPVKTDILQNSGYDPKTVPQIWEIVKGMMSLNKFADAEEMADLTTFVASDKGRSITGASLFIDNGSLLK